MEIYAKRFTQASLIYLGVGVLVGITMVGWPGALARLRFAGVFFFGLASCARTPRTRLLARTGSSPACMAA